MIMRSENQAKAYNDKRVTYRTLYDNKPFNFNRWLFINKYEKMRKFKSSSDILELLLKKKQYLIIFFSEDQLKKNLVYQNYLKFVRESPRGAIFS